MWRPFGARCPCGAHAVPAWCARGASVVPASCTSARCQCGTRVVHVRPVPVRHPRLPCLSGGGGADGDALSPGLDTNGARQSQREDRNEGVDPVCCTNR